MVTDLRVDEDMGRAQLARALAEALGEGIDAFDLAYAPVQDSVRIVSSRDGSRLAVHYVAKDEYPPADFWLPVLGNGELFAAVEADAKRVVERCGALGIPVYGVDVASVVPTVFEPSSRVPTHLYVPPSAAVDELRAGTITVAALKERCRRTLETYVAWKEGGLCGVVTETFRVASDGTLDQLDQGAQWPCLDLEAARSLRDDGVRAEAGRNPVGEADAFRP